MIRKSICLSVAGAISLAARSSDCVGKTVGLELEFGIGMKPKKTAYALTK